MSTDWLDPYIRPHVSSSSSLKQNVDLEPNEGFYALAGFAII